MKKHHLYVVRKYIKAHSASHAIRKDKSTPVHDCWMDESWKEKSLTEAIGFHEVYDEEEDEE